MRLSARRLNRTLLHRQHLLARVPLSPVELVGHLVGLQAQEPTPPYLGMAARLTTVDPYAVSELIEAGDLIRIGTLRGTIHLHTPADAARLRAWCQPVFDAQNRVAGNVHAARGVPDDDLETALADVLADGPLPLAEISARLATVFPGVPSAALGGRARNARLGLAQMPPRGLWKRSGGVVYDTLSRLTGVPIEPPTPAQVAETVRRYLAAFGPAGVADVATWSGVTRLAPVLKAMTDLIRYEDESGKPLWDIPDGVLADEDAPAPVRLLGTYDNVWLSHAGRDRVMTGDARAAWAGRNGGVASVILVDGYVAGLWKVIDNHVEVTRLLRDLSPDEQADLGSEIARTDVLLAQ